MNLVIHNLTVWLLTVDAVPYQRLCQSLCTNYNSSLLLETRRL